MGEGVRDQALQGLGQKLAPCWSHLTHGLFETFVTYPACLATLVPAESQPWAGELGAHSLPTSHFISLRGIGCAPSPTENLVVIVEARAQWDGYPSLVFGPRSVYYSG